MEHSVSSYTVLSDVPLSAFTSTMNYKDTELLVSLLKNGADPSQSVVVLSPPERKGLFSKFKSKKTVPEGTYPLALYCARGNIEAVRILLADKRVDPAVEDSIALRQAYFSSRPHIVHLLLDDGRADPLADNGRMINHAVRNGHIDMIAVLLNDERVIRRRKEVSATIYANI